MLFLICLANSTIVSTKFKDVNHKKILSKSPYF